MEVQLIVINILMHSNVLIPSNFDDVHAIDEEEYWPKNTALWHAAGR